MLTAVIYGWSTFLLTCFLFLVSNMDEKNRGHGKLCFCHHEPCFFSSAFDLNAVGHNTLCQLYQFVWSHRTPAYRCLHKYFQRYQPVFILCVPKLSKQPTVPLQWELQKQRDHTYHNHINTCISLDPREPLWLLVASTLDQTLVGNSGSTFCRFNPFLLTKT